MSTSRGAVASVIGPDGRRLSRVNLPPPDTRRWVTRRKAEIVAAVEGGLITMEAACAIYSLSPEEFNTWHQLYSAHGVKGLRATRVQMYR